jgi:hypothetical protein
MNAVTKIKTDNAAPVDGVATFAEAFVKLQADIRPAIKDATNPAFRSKYADLAAVWEAVKQPLAAHGFSVIQSPDFDGDAMWLKTTILHMSGERIEGRYPIRPVKNDPQGFGSAITYARRYSISAMLGVIADDDDDGNAASGLNGTKATTGTITPDQVKTLRELIARVSADIEKFCQHFKIEALPDLPAGKYSTAIEMLNMRGVKP